MLADLQTPVERHPSDLCLALQTVLSERRLSAWFQPIVASRQQGIFGYEALIRGPSDTALHSPVSLFNAAERCGNLSELDLLCRKVAIAGFGRLALPGRLFLNVTPSTVVQTNFRSGETARFLSLCGISPDRVVIELTEHMPIHDYEVMRLAVAHYRQMGFSIAIDDLGAGYSGLRHWAELRPDYVKIDSHFIQGVDQDPNKQAFVRSILDMARNLNCQVIAEGIETLEEYRSLWSMGVELGQGYLFARPAPYPPLRISKLLPSNEAQPVGHRFGESVRTLIRDVPGVAPDTAADEVASIFQRQPRTRALVVIDNQRPVGIVRRAQLLDLFSTQYGRSLYGKRPIGSLASKDVLLARDDMAVEALSQQITESDDLAGDEAFVVVDEQGRYLGQGTLIDLLRRITELQIRNARYANPLTGLPGNVPITEHIDALLRESKPFMVAYCDLDRFKAFNDCYGYARGDDLIVALSRVLREAAAAEGDFLGHVGGDDFVLVLRGTDWEARCRRALTRFDALAPWHYDEHHRTAGGFHGHDRQGNAVFHPTVTLSIAALPVEPGCFHSPHEVAGVLSELKAQAKAREGSTLFVERRKQAVASSAHA